VLTISELIRQAKERSGLSFRAMAEQATLAGHRVSHQYLQELTSSGPKNWPRHAETIKGLAAATNTTEVAVVLAFARSFGLRVDTTSVASRVPPEADALPAGIQDAVTALIWALTRELAPAPPDPEPEAG
jgi:transcriptional regulator with XRE-family HTH domain